jgi:hypothetical protein
MNSPIDKIANRWPTWLHMHAVVAAGLAAIAVLATACAASAPAFAGEAVLLGTEGVETPHPRLGVFTEAACEPGGPHHEFECQPGTPTATIHWGDGTTSVGIAKLVPGGCDETHGFCEFAVEGPGHRYAEEKPDPQEAREGKSGYRGTVEWEDQHCGACHGVAKGSISFTATIADSSLTINSVAVKRSGATGTLEAEWQDGPSFADQYVGRTTDFAVTINWGDGTETHPVVERALFGEGGAHYCCVVKESHEYTKPNASVEITIVDDGGQHKEESKALPSLSETRTEPASAISHTGATLNGEVTPKSGFAVEECYFEWGETTQYGQVTTCAQATPIHASEKVGAEIYGLKEATTYHFRLVTKSAAGIGRGEDETFRTEAPTVLGAPSVVTEPAFAEQTAATLEGRVNPNGGTVADCHFEWGTTTAYGSSIPCTRDVGYELGTPFTTNARLTGLTPGTVYHYRIVAANTGTTPSYGADASFTTLPTCEVAVEFGYVAAKGCLAHRGDTYVSTPGSTVSVDGLTLTPTSAGTKVTINPSARTLSAAGPLRVSAGEVVLVEGEWGFTEPEPNGALAVSLGALSPPVGSGIGGLPFEGELALSLNSKKGADITANLGLPLGKIGLPEGQIPSGKILGLLGVNVTAQLHTALATGLKQDEISAKKQDLKIGPLEVKNLKLVYSPTEDLWDGGAAIVLPTPNKLEIAAELSFLDGRFHRFYGSVNGLNVQITDGIFLQRIAVLFGIEPLTIGGGLGISFGPQINGITLVRLDGNFAYQEPRPEQPGHFFVEGLLGLLGFKLAGAYFHYYTSGLIQFGAQLKVGLPEESGEIPEPLNPPTPQQLQEEKNNKPLYVEAALNGAVYHSKLDAEATAAVRLNALGFHAQVTGEALLSEIGLVGCAELNVFGFHVNVGGSYTWATRQLELIGKNCSVGPFRTVELGSLASAAANGHTFRLAAGHAWLALAGVGGPPRITLSGPGGQRVSVPTSSTAPLMVKGFVVLQDPEDKTTYIAIQNAGGTWHEAPEPGSPAVRAIDSASILPAPSVSAHVQGHGRRRTLRWHMRQVPGQRVVFWEKGADSAQVIGSTSAADGRLRFTLANAPAGRRTIVAQVLSFGKPRKDSALASFEAPREQLPGRPEHLKVSAATDGGVLVSWHSSALAQRYTVDVAAHGSHLVEVVDGRAHSVVVNDVLPITAAIVSVTGETDAGVSGPAARATLSPTTHQGAGRHSRRHLHGSTHRRGARAKRQKRH